MERKTIYQHRSDNGTVDSAAIDELRQQLWGIRRDAISVVRTAEAMLNLPPDKRAIVNRSDAPLDKDTAPD